MASPSPPRPAEDAWPADLVFGSGVRKTGSKRDLAIKAGFGATTPRMPLPSRAAANGCPNRPEWAAPVPAIQQGKCMWCSKVRGEWVECEAGNA